MNNRLDDINRVTQYAENGVSGISVLTERRHFSGSYTDLEEVCGVCRLPVLCKDFIYFEEQVDAAYLCGADMVLIIVRSLDDREIKKLYSKTIALGMTPLLEVHEKSELSRIYDLNPEVILVNMRNLDSLEMNFTAGIETLCSIPENITSISASGINSPEDIKRIFSESGISNFLIGTSLMNHEDPGSMIREFKNVR